MKRMLIVAISTLITVIIWIGFSIYSSQSNYNQMSVSTANIGNFNNVLHTQTFAKVVKAQKYICINVDFTAKPCSGATAL
jgi:hypothetical protein